jgi:hypothetical protein
MKTTGTGKKITQIDEKSQMSSGWHKPTAASGTTLPYPPNPRTSGVAKVFNMTFALYSASIVLLKNIFSTILKYTKIKPAAVLDTTLPYPPNPRTSGAALVFKLSHFLIYFFTLINLPELNLFEEAQK